MVNLSKEADSMMARFIRDGALVEPAEYNAAMSVKDKTGKGMLSVLMEKGVIDEDSIVEALIKKFNFRREKVPQNIIVNRPFKERVTASFVKQNRLVTFRESDVAVGVLVSDQFGINNIKKLKPIVGNKNIEVYVCSLSEMESHIQTAVQSGGANGAAAGAAPTPAPAAGDQKIVKNIANGAADNKALPPKEAFIQALAESEQKHKTNGSAPATEDTKKAPQVIKAGSNVIDYVDSLIKLAIEKGVSDIHCEVYHEDARLRFRKNGVLQEMEEFKEFLVKNYSAVVTRIKILASLDISERRLPQDGGIAFFMDDGNEVDLRVSILPTADGERVVMRIMSGDTMSLGLDQLGFSEVNYKVLDKSIKAPQGLILVTGPTGSGKSTTLYAVLNALNTDDVNILTAEDPVEFNVNGIGQVQVKEKIGLTFSAALRSFLRQDPEIIMVGEIRDKETGDIAVKAALTGHLVLSTLHTNDAPSTITRLLNMGIPGYLVSSSVAVVVAQRLARVNCPECKVVDEDVSAERLEAFGFSKEEASSMKVYKSTGCEVCMNTGVKGRRAVHEVLEMTDNVKEEVLKGSSDIRIREVAAEEGFKTMQEVGRDLIREGVITVTEFQRILVLD